MFTNLVLAGAILAGGHAAPVYHAETLRVGVEDTTVAVTADLDPSYGYVWAHDNIIYTATISPVANVSGEYNVAINESGVYNAEANPVTGVPWSHVGVFTGTLDYTVTASAPPSGHLPAVEPGTVHSGDLLTAMFNGTSPTVDGSSYSFTYFGIPGYPSGWTQNG
jgi:hypothetical protein